jgi:hypothetical protein
LNSDCNKKDFLKRKRCSASSSNSSNSALSSNMKRKYTDVVGPEELSAQTLNGSSFRAKKLLAASNQSTMKNPQPSFPLDQAGNSNQIRSSGSNMLYDRFVAFSSSKPLSSSSSSLEKENTRNGTATSGEGNSNNRHLHCSICKDLASNPCADSCGHVCCQNCWMECLKRSKACPVCRAPVGKETMKKLKIISKS